MKKLFVLILIVALTACSVKLLPITQTDADRAAMMFPGTTTADLETGKNIYLDNCGKCHPYKKPETRTETEWRQIVPKMAKKAKINKEQEDKVLKYLITMSQAKKLENKN